MNILKDDLKALRTANTVVFHYTQKDGHFIRALRDKERGDIFSSGRFDCDERKIMVEGRGVCDTAECVASVSYSNDAQMPFYTIAKHLRADDLIRLVWYQDAFTTGQMKDDTDLHADVLYLEIYRKDKFVGKYIVDVSICADNTARMIRFNNR